MTLKIIYKDINSLIPYVNNARTHISKSSMRCGIRIVQHKTHLYQGLKPYFRDLPNVFSP